MKYCGIVEAATTTNFDENLFDMTQEKGSQMTSCVKVLFTLFSHVRLMLNIQSVPGNLKTKGR